MFSLCIPTMDRWDPFLKESLPKYIDNDLIDEIIIVDENGHDVSDIQRCLSPIQLKKLKLFTNTKQLGPFLNKIEAISLATCDWVVLIDSDNFAPREYFTTLKEYTPKTNVFTILAPEQALPHFDYRELSGKLLDKNAVRTEKAGCLECFMNTGNFCLNRNLISKLSLEKERENISKSPSCDVIFFNMLCYEQIPEYALYPVPGLVYQHRVHDGSVYVQKSNKFKEFNEQVYKRFRSI